VARRAIWVWDRPAQTFHGLGKRALNDALSTVDAPRNNPTYVSTAVHDYEHRVKP
jgi:hypothetical protein